jgi:hypothetical protein
VAEARSAHRLTPSRQELGSRRDADAANSAGAFVGDPLRAFVNVHFKQ